MTTKHDWIEDLGTPSGEYSHVCTQCGAPYVGHKHRLGECKACAILGWQRLAVETLKLRYWYSVDQHRPDDRQLVLVYYPERTIGDSTYAARRDITRYYADEVYADDDVDLKGFMYNGDIGDCAPTYWTNVLDVPNPDPKIGNISPHLILGVDLADPNTRDYTP